MLQFIYSIITNIIAIVLAIGICIFIWLTEPGKMQEYYEDKANYVTATGRVTHLASSDDGKTFYLGFSEELTPEFDDTTFKIVGKNVDIAKKNKIWKYVKEGETVEFVTAPKYWGDGYCMPIVALSVNGEEILGFEDGYDNLQEWLEE